jgi:hypothetical protein
MELCQRCYKTFGEAAAYDMEEVTLTENYDVFKSIRPDLPYGVGTDLLDSPLYGD